MNKIFTTFTLLFSTLYFVQAQDGYVKYQKDSDYKNKTIKVLNGEIVPFTNSPNLDKINIIFGGDTITDIKKSSDNFSEVSPNTSYHLQKDDFLQTKVGGLVWVNVNNISNSDTVTLLSESGKQVTQLIEKRDVHVNISELGKTCRLIISNSPTIFYSTSNLKQFSEPEPFQETDNIETQEGKTETGWVWWHYAVIALSVGGLGFGIHIFIKKRKKLKPNEVVFNSKSLKDFASPYGGVRKLSELNPNLIPPNWDKLQNPEKQKIVNKLKGKRLIIHAEDETIFGFQGDNYQTNDEQSHSESSKETTGQSANFGNTNELSTQLRQMEDKLFREIQRLSSGNTNSNQLNELLREKEGLETKFRTLENEKRKVDAKFMQMQKDISTAENNLHNAREETISFQNEIKELKQRVITLDFLKEYSESVYSYLKFCQQVSNEAYNFFNKINRQNPNQAFAAGHLLMKFQTSINSIPIGNWIQTVQDIKDTGATTNKQLLRSFSQIQSDVDKHKEFQRLLFTEVLTKYSSNTLNLSEAFKNLSRFQVSSELANDVQNTFGRHVTEILNKAKVIGLEIKYVSLFKNFEEYLGQIESVDKERSLAYKEVSGLQKNEIAEIDSFGVKTHFEDSKTYVILA